MKAVFRFLLILLFSVAPITLMAKGDCPYCKGTGKIVKTLTVSNYGHDTKKKCPECGEWHYSDHAHVYCQHCRGTGWKQSSSSSSSSSGRSSSSSVDTWTPGSTPDVHALYESPYEYAQNLQYGCKWCDDEARLYFALQKSNPQLAQRYFEARRIMDSFIQDCSRNYNMGNYRWQEPEDIARSWEATVKRYNDYLRQGYVASTELAPYLDQVAKIAQQKRDNYIGVVRSFSNLRHQQEALEWQMMMF